MYISYHYSETLQLQTIHHVLQLIASYYENILMNKRDKHIAVEWTQRYLLIIHRPIN